LRKLSFTEISRKLLHCLAVLLAVGILNGPRFLDVPQFTICVVIATILLCCLIVECSRFRSARFGGLFHRLFGWMLRDCERRKVTGATHLMTGAFICSLIALESRHAAGAAFLGLTLFILGDASAALIGKAFGQTRIGQKTFAGALGCFVICSLVCGFVFPRLPTFIDAWGGELALPQILLLATVVTLLELFPLRLGSLTMNDNFHGPVLTTLSALIIRLI
jgi:dolichol kinase